MRRQALLVAALLALVAPASAAAAPFELGAGRDASAVMDAAGTAHIVFDSSPNVATSIATYCRLPRGARACDVRTEMPLDLSDDPRIFRRASDGALIVLQVDGRDYDSDPANFVSGGAWIRVSTDGGATFSAPALIATGIGSPNAVELAADGEALVTLEANDDGTMFRRLPFAGPDPRTLRIDARESLISSALGVAADGRMVVVTEHRVPARDVQAARRVLSHVARGLPHVRPHRHAREIVVRAHVAPVPHAQRGS